MFDLDKKSQLAKKDRSKKGSVDAQIKPLITAINKHPDYYTTSSCAGRIVLFSPDRKDRFNMLLVSHSRISLKRLNEALENIPKSDVYLRQESFILHVACRNMDAAEKLLKLAQSHGLKRAGIISTKRIIVELVSTEHFDSIIAENGHVLIDQIYLKVLLSRAHEKMKKNKIKTSYFCRSFIAKMIAKTITTR